MKDNEFNFSKTDKIDDAYILTNHIRQLMIDARTNTTAFIQGVNVLEDWIDATNDSQYMSDLESFVNAPYWKIMEKMGSYENDGGQIDALLFNKARGKFRLLRQLCVRKGLTREESATLEEDDFDIDEDDEEEENDEKF